MSTIKDNAKLLALKEEITVALTAGNLEEKMDVIRLKAADINIGDNELNELILKIKKENEGKAALIKRIEPKKNWIRYSSLAIVVIEWILAFAIAGKLSFWELLLLLIINLVSALAIVFGFAIAIKTKKI